MSRKLNVSNLYPLAVLEGEGMGTAYEYSVKLSVLDRFVRETGIPRSAVIGGLPEAYGLDLSLSLLCARYGCKVVVADDRPAILETFTRLIQSPELSAFLDPARFSTHLTASLADPLGEGDQVFDLWLSTTAIQRLSDEDLASYLAQVRSRARYAALLAPNTDNRAHLTLSGLDGFSLPDLVGVCRRAGFEVPRSGYLDLPPFPPGLQRSNEAKERAAHSPVEQAAMWVLEMWGRCEFLIPHSIRRRYSHLGYVLLAGS